MSPLLGLLWAPLSELQLIWSLLSGTAAAPPAPGTSPAGCGCGLSLRPGLHLDGRIDTHRVTGALEAKEMVGIIFCFAVLWWLLGCINAQCIYCSFTWNHLSALRFHCSLEFFHPSGIQQELDRSDHLVPVGLRAKPSPVRMCQNLSVLVPSWHLQQWEHLWHCWTPTILLPFSYRFWVFSRHLQSQGVSVYSLLSLPFSIPVTLPIYHKPAHNSTLELSNLSTDERPKLVSFLF